MEIKKFNAGFEDWHRLLICQPLPCGDNFNVYSFLHYSLFLVFSDDQCCVDIHKTREADQCVYFSVSGLAVAQRIAYLDGKMCIGHYKVNFHLLVVIIEGLSILLVKSDGDYILQ